MSRIGNMLENTLPDPYLYWQLSNCWIWNIKSTIISFREDHVRIHSGFWVINFRLEILGFSIEENTTLWFMRRVKIIVSSIYVASQTSCCKKKHHFLLVNIIDFSIGILKSITYFSSLPFQTFFSIQLSELSSAENMSFIHF